MKMKQPVVNINLLQDLKVEGCPKCEALVSEEEGCGCSMKYESSEEKGKKCSCAIRAKLHYVKMPTSEESSEYDPSSNEEKRYCKKKMRTSRKKGCFIDEESSEETKEECQEESSEEKEFCEKCGHKTKGISSEEEPFHSVGVQTSGGICKCKLPSNKKKEYCNHEVQTLKKKCFFIDKESSEETKQKCPEESSEEEQSCKKWGRNTKAISSEEVPFRSVGVQKSGGTCICKLPSNKKKEYCNKEVQTSKQKCDLTTEFSSEESKEECQKQCSEEKPKKHDVIINCPSSEETSDELPKCKKNKTCESSEEIQTKSSEECSFSSPEVASKKCNSVPKVKKFQSSEETYEKSSEEIKYTDSDLQDDTGEIYDEEHWCHGKPIRVYPKSQSLFRHNP